MTKSSAVPKGHIDNVTVPYVAGIVGYSKGNTYLISCRSSVEIKTEKSGWGNHGGLVGEIVKGGTYLYFVDCLFDGKFVGSKTDCWGGFGGWKADGPDVHFTNDAYTLTMTDANTVISSDISYLN